MLLEFIEIRLLPNCVQYRETIEGHEWGRRTCLLAKNELIGFNYARTTTFTYVIKYVGTFIRKRPVGKYQNFDLYYSNKCGVICSSTRISIPYKKFNKSRFFIK